MSRFLLVTWEGGGVVPPELGIARRLVGRGHSVRVLADPSVEPAARAAACEFSPWVTAPHRHSLAPEEDPLRDWEFKNILALFKHALQTFISGPAGKFAADTRAVLAQHPADVVLVDGMIFGGMIAAESLRLPTAALIPNVYMRPAPGIPPFGPGFQPAAGPISRLRDALLTGISARMWRDALPGINAARTGVGLAPVTDFWGQYDRLARVLVLTSPSFDFPATSLPPNVTYAGPVLDDPSWADRWTAPWPASNRDPLVLVGLSSTYQNQSAVLQNIVAALAAMPVRALVTLGPALAKDAVTSPSSNVVIVPTAPHGEVLKQAALAITHCGHGTTIRALAAGVPLVCMPMGRDQNDTAARVVYRGAGVRIKPTATAGAIRRAVERVLQDPSYRSGAQALRDAISREATTIDPVAEIEALERFLGRFVSVVAAARESDGLDSGSIENRLRRGARP